MVGGMKGERGHRSERRHVPGAEVDHRSPDLVLRVAEVGSQSLGIDARSAGIDARGLSLDDQRLSIDARRSSIDAQ